MRWGFAFLVLLLLTASVTAINVNGEAFTGKPFQYFGMNITILYAPTISLIAPKNGTYFVNVSIPLDYSITGGTDRIWYSLDSGNNVTITSPIFFNATEGGHRLFLYANNSIGETATNVSFFVNSTRFNIIHDKWKGSQKGSSTNFSVLTYEEIQNLSNFILEDTSYGKILFNQGINITADENSSDNQADINSTIEISSNSIKLNSTALPNLNKPATLWLYSLGFSDPRVLIDGDPCPSIICKKESYLGGVLKFNVTSFLGNFSAEETPAGLVTVVAGGGGGGGGGIIGYLFPKPHTFSLDPAEIKLSLTPGKVVTKEITIKNNAGKDLLITLENKNLDDFLVTKENQFSLKANETKKINLDFVIREGTLPDLYIGRLIFKDDSGNDEEILVLIGIGTEGALLDVNVEVLEEYARVSPGSRVLAKISLFNLGPENRRNDITINYLIKSEKGVEVLEEKETVSIETQTGWVKRLTIPRGIEYEKYVLYVTAVTNDGKIASASDTFEVVAPQVAKVYILITTLVVIIGTIVLYFSVIRRGQTGELIKRLDIMDIVGEE